MDSDSAREPFERVFMHGQTLVVELVSDAVVDRVNVIAPDGSEFASRPVATGASRVEVQISTNYAPGVHHIVAVQSGETIAKRQLDIQPELAIVDIGIGANTPGRIPEERGQLREFEAWVEVENRGKGPVAIEKLLFLGGVPNPTSELAAISEEEDVSGIFDAGRGQGELDRVNIGSSGEATLFTNTLPFSFEGDGVDCSEQSSHQFTVELVATPSASVTRKFIATYEPEAGSDSCQISIEPR